MKNKLSLIIPFLILVVGVAIAYNFIKADRTLPIYSPSQLNPELVDESLQLKKSKHRIANFNLIDQDGEEFSQADLEGKYYVADFFFTTCPSICIDMSEQLRRVQEEYMEDSQFRILSHTVHPEVDSAETLKAYAELQDANPDKWIFVTGEKQQIYELARKSYFAATTEGDGGVDDFIHTENFILIDKEKRIRGFYDGTSEEDVDRLINDIGILAYEYEK